MFLFTLVKVNSASSESNGPFWTVGGNCRAVYKTQAGMRELWLTLLQLAQMWTGAERFVSPCVVWVVGGRWGCSVWGRSGPGLTETSARGEEHRGGVAKRWRHAGKHRRIEKCDKNISRAKDKAGFYYRLPHSLEYCLKYSSGFRDNTSNSFDMWLFMPTLTH